MPKRKSVRRGRTWEGERFLYPFSDNGQMPKWCSGAKVKIRITEILPKRAKRKGKKNAKA